MAEHHATSRPIRAESWPLVVWAARLSVYFLAQGALVLLAYAYYGFGSDPESFALGFRIDPIQAGVNLAWGLIGTYIGFFRPRYAIPFVLAFAAFYSALAVLGSFTSTDLGMMLNDRVNRFHWLIVLPAWAIALYALWRKRRLP
jgi:formate hydrogenlyase subunit 3/multisubunit Na+/H+ antiporter MnhD subunit